MAQEIEIEYKNLLTKEEFNHLLSHLPFPENGQEQTNHYFETSDFSLQAHSSALRIREKNKSFQLTLKEPHVEGLLETHDLLTQEEAFNWFNGHIIKKEHTSKQLAAFNISPESLQYYGSLTTIRRQVKYEDVLLVLDYSTYNGQTDYEFELEAPNETVGIKKFDYILDKYKITKKNTPNKIHRFFTTLEN